jgi:MarR family transcriptional regulator, 2-MHQ and catechol-resistance regulon repressor
MSIENDIQQKTFKNPYQKVIINLMYTHSWLTGHQAKRLKPFGLTVQQYNVLRILRGQHPRPATVNLIIERMIDKMSNASRLVDKLLAKKLVERRVCPQDRRAVDVLITEEGLNLLAKIDVLQAEWEKTFSGLSPDEALQLSDLLDKMRG